MDPLFTSHRLTDEGLTRVRAIAQEFNTLLERITGLSPDTTYGLPLVPEGRELALVRTHLETACFFAKKALASQPQYQEPEVR